MAVRAITPNYEFAARDTQSNYGDNILLYIGWDHHTLFCSAKAFLISPQATFQQLVDELLPAGFSQHPDFSNIDWSKVEYVVDHNKIQPQSEQKLADLGFGHKSLLRFNTPGLTGYNGSHV